MSTTFPMSGQRSWWQGQVAASEILNSGTVTQRPGAAIQISASTTAVVDLTLVADGSVVRVNPQVGDNLYPYQVVLAIVQSGTVTAMYNLFPA